jgi:hypothetical protein
MVQTAVRVWDEGDKGAEHGLVNYKDAKAYACFKHRGQFSGINLPSVLNVILQL